MDNDGTKPKPGRPRIDPQMLKIPVGYKLTRWMVEWMREESRSPGSPSAAVLIENALRAHYGLKSPEMNGSND